MPASAVNISVTIITLNEERNIGRCLDSVRTVADEIVVVDSFSTDRTRAICEEKGARFVEHSFETYIAQKNVAVDLATYDYILALDADEALSEELTASILHVKADWSHDGYSFNRLTNYCGTWIRHGGWYPDRQMRLWNRRKGRWGGVNPHDHVVLSEDASRTTLRGDLLHYSFYSLSDHLKVIDNFTELQSLELFKAGVTPHAEQIVIRPAFKFFRDYVLKAGFLDGIAGCCVAVLSATATFVKYAKLRMLYRAGAR